MTSDRQGRFAWFIALSLAVLGAVLWYVASGQRREIAVAAPIEAAHGATSEPSPVLPQPAVPIPLVAETVGVAPVADSPERVGAAVVPTVSSKAGAVLDVLVVDPRGVAVEGAEVVAQSGVPERERTGADGHARIEAPPGASVGVAARHSDFRLAAGRATLGTDAGSVTELTLQLTGGLIVCIEVQARDGRTIEGAEVRFKEIEKGIFDGSRIGSPELLLRVEASHHIRGEFEETRTTDAQGRCCVNGAASGTMALSVEAEGYVPVTSLDFEVDADGGDLGVIVLEPAFALRGIVEDASGGVPGALVEVYLGITTPRTTPEGRDRFVRAYRRTTTAADGRFEIGGARSLPARASVQVSHPERGHFYAGDMSFTEQPVHVMLVPAVEAVFELSDAQTKQPIEGEAHLELPVDTSDLSLTALAWATQMSAGPRKVSVRAGRLELTDLPHYLNALRLEVDGYDPLEVPMKTILDDADRVLAFELTRPVQFLVRVHAAGSGALLEHARLFVVRAARDSKGRGVGGWFLLQETRFDAQSGGYVVSEADLRITGSEEITLVAEAKGYARSEAVPVASHGQRTCGPTVDLYLDPE